MYLISNAKCISDFPLWISAQLCKMLSYHYASYEYMSALSEFGKEDANFECKCILAILLG